MDGMKYEELAELVDGFARTCDFEFAFDELLDHVWARSEEVDEDDVYGLASSSSYLFQTTDDPTNPRFMPRRMFFQGAEFRIVPTAEEVEGGYLLAGHRFMPFISRDVFPPDAWLVLPDGSAPHVRRVTMPLRQAREMLTLYGEDGAANYLTTDEKGNERKLAGSGKGKVEVTTFDLAGFYDGCGFAPGDALMVRVLDWLQGVYAVTHVEAAETASLQIVREWTLSMRNAYEAMHAELGFEADCYEQLAIMMLIGGRGPRPLMKQPPLPIEGFLLSQEDLAIKPVADRVVICPVDADPVVGAMQEMLEEMEELGGRLDAYFKQLGLSLRESEAEAYMRDALCHGAAGPEPVLARVCAGRSLFFRSAEEQEEFHALWCELWEQVGEAYSPDGDPYAQARSRLLEINDRCIATVRALDARGALEKAARSQAFKDFGMLSTSLASMLLLLNTVEGMADIPLDELDEMVDNLEPAIGKVLDRLEEV